MKLRTMSAVFAIFISVYVGFSFEAKSENTSFKVFVIKDHLDLYYEILDGRDPLDVTQFEASSQFSREIVEVHLMHVAPLGLVAV